ncbi:MAG: histidinol dehydrogenase [Firmicutes bacterium]|nr:histidinol dehydrogenase [Bacillota bacterium]
MIKIIDIEDFKLERYSSDLNDRVEKDVAEILADVKKDGDKAVLKYAKKFDNASEIKVLNKTDLKAAYESCDRIIIDALEACARNIEAFHKNQIQEGFEINADGRVVGQKVRALKNVGIYVPGGTAPYPSSVLMCAIPAKLAGVENIVMLNPAKDGKVLKEVLAAAYIGKVDKVILLGGAHGVAALAYGTETIAAVDKIVGPGNVYVAAAKRQLIGVIDADIIAGPSEILIVADDSANERFVAADMLSQAEHDVLAKSILITLSKEFAKKVQSCIETQLKNLERNVIAGESINSLGRIIVAKNINQVIDLANAIAPEHLEICLKDPMSYLDKFVNSGTVFMGNYSPESLGDYFAGTNHVLPTSGTARFSSPLSVQSFTKKYSYIYYNKESLETAKGAISAVADIEGFTAHKKAVEIRFEK